MTRKLAYSLLVLFALPMLLSAGNLFFTSTQTGQLSAVVHAQAMLLAKLEVAILASCASAADIGQAPVAVDPATGKASVLGVKLVSDFRAQWRTLGCPGQLPPPQPSFVKWARYYHLPSS